MILNSVRFSALFLTTFMLAVSASAAPVGSVGGEKKGTIGAISISCTYPNGVVVDSTDPRFEDCVGAVKPKKAKAAAEKIEQTLHLLNYKVLAGESGSQQ